MSVVVEGVSALSSPQRLLRPDSRLLTTDCYLCLLPAYPAVDSRTINSPGNTITRASAGAVP